MKRLLRSSRQPGAILLLLIFTIVSSGCTTGESAHPSQIIDYSPPENWEMTRNGTHFVEFRHENRRDIGTTNLYPKIMVASQKSNIPVGSIYDNKSEALNLAEAENIMDEKVSRGQNMSSEVLRLGENSWKHTNITYEAANKDAKGSLHIFLTYDNSTVIYLEMFDEGKKGGKKNRYNAFIDSIKEAEIY